MSLNHIVETNHVHKSTSKLKKDLDSAICTGIKGACIVAKVFEEYSPLIKTFLSVGKEIVDLYNKAEHNKELCSFLLQRCNCAMAAVQDLSIRKTENTKFFSKKENLGLFKEFIKCMIGIRDLVKKISQLSKLRRFIYAVNIEGAINDLTAEFDGYMDSLNFSFAIQARDEFATIKYDLSQIKEVMFRAYGVSDDKQTQQNFLNGMNLVTERNKEFQEKVEQNKILESSEVLTLEKNEPLLDGSQYQKTNVCPSKEIEKRISFDHCDDEYCFKELDSSPPGQSNNEQIQIEIRKQVNILKELKNSEYISRFFGVAREKSKYYLVTEWMEYGNLKEYYTSFKDNMTWETKIRFALDICRGVAYLHECQILHHDIRSENILVNRNIQVKIANFGLSRRFSELTGSVSSNIVDVIRYMAPEKLFGHKIPYDYKCEVYSVGALLWEIAELKKPHSDLNKSGLLVSIKNRVQERYYEPFSNDVPVEWKFIVSRAMEYERVWRSDISDICHYLYDLSDERDDYSSDDYSEDDKERLSLTNDDQNETDISFFNIKILSVDDAIREHKSKDGKKQVAWDSFKYHSMTNIEARYWVGYYYYHHGEDIPELQKINKKERIKTAIDIFKETADKGNVSAQLKYGRYLLQSAEASFQPLHM